jgi:hypothetical protein
MISMHLTFVVCIFYYVLYYVRAKHMKSHWEETK